MSHRARWRRSPSCDCEASFTVERRLDRLGAVLRLSEVARGESRQHMAERNVFTTPHHRATYDSNRSRVRRVRDPATKRQWFAEGEGWRIDEYGLDFRVGGREHGRFRSGNGPETRNETVYLDIVPDRRIVMVHDGSRRQEYLCVSWHGRIRGLGAARGSSTQSRRVFDGADGPRPENRAGMDSSSVSRQRSGKKMRQAAARASTHRQRP